MDMQQSAISSINQLKHSNCQSLIAMNQYWTEAAFASAHLHSLNMVTLAQQVRDNAKLVIEICQAQRTPLLGKRSCQWTDPGKTKHKKLAMEGK